MVSIFGDDNATDKQNKTKLPVNPKNTVFRHLTKNKTNRTYLHFKETISSSLQWGKIKRCQVGNIYMLGNS